VPALTGPRSSRRWLVSAAVLGLAAPVPGRAAEIEGWSGAEQIVLVAVERDDGLRAKVSLLEKASGVWRTHRKDLPAVIGKKGLAIGAGLHRLNEVPTRLPLKKEGDLKTPAGVFRLGPAYGYAARPPSPFKQAYTQLRDSHQGVDDPASRWYNQIVDSAALPGGAAPDWKSREVMRRADDLYKWLAVIGHNERAVPGGGSLIFLHVWRAADKGTAGCTALAEGHLLDILGWLDPAKRPVFVALPEKEAKAWRKGPPVLKSRPARR